MSAHSLYSFESLLDSSDKCLEEQFFMPDTEVLLRLSVYLGELLSTHEVQIHLIFICEYICN